MGLEIEGKEINVIKAKNARYRQKEEIMDVIERISNECEKVAVTFEGDKATVFGCGCRGKNRENTFASLQY